MAVDSSPRPTTRSSPVALVMSRFPAVTETFILRELVELERQGVEVVLVPLLHDEVSVLHPEAEPWDRRALYTGFLSLPMLTANLRVFFSAPWPYLSTLLGLLWDARSSFNAFSGILGIFMKSVWNGQRVRARGVRHIHANYATHPAAAAYIMSRVHYADEPDLPYSLTIHAHDIFVSHAGLRRKLSAARFVRSISEFNVRYLLDRFGTGNPKLTPEQFRVIHCGIEPDLYQQRPPMGEPGRDRTALLLCIAAHRPYKGLTYLIEAVRLLHADELDVRCDVIGEGYLRPQLEEQIREAGLEERFRLVGTRTQGQVAEAFARCDLFVLPSIVAPDGQMEGIPVALMESLAAGLPTISTRVSGIPELVIDGETGLVVAPADATALAGAVKWVLENYPAARTLGAAGGRLVRNEFEIRENVRRLIAEIRAATD